VLDIEGGRSEKVSTRGLTIGTLFAVSHRSILVFSAQPSTQRDISRYRYHPKFWKSRSEVSVASQGTEEAQRGVESISRIFFGCFPAMRPRWPLMLYAYSLLHERDILP
jgi:hypothetical protein